MTEIKAYDMGRFQRVVAVEGARVTGKFWTNRSKAEDSTWVHALDVTIWNEERSFGITLQSGDLSCDVHDGTADLREHMINSRKLDDVRDVWEEMKVVLVTVAEAATYDAEPSGVPVTGKDGEQWN